VPLNEELLARLERCLSDQRVPWLSARRQPLSDDEMDQLTAPVGIELPPELRLWWRWFNGASRPQRVELTPVLEVVSLEVSLRGRETMMDVASQLTEAPDDAERLYPSSFVPVFGSGGSVTVAADSAVGPATPLHYVEFHPNDHPLVMLAPSLGDAVHRWVEMYEAGYYRWDAAREEWDFSRHNAALQPTITLLT
jgi:hypothetical protein